VCGVWSWKTTHLIGLGWIELDGFAFDYIGALYCGCSFFVIYYLAVSSTVLQI
jgi:hypothetical protein